MLDSLLPLVPFIYLVSVLGFALLFYNNLNGVQAIVFSFVSIALGVLFLPLIFNMTNYAGGEYEGGEEVEFYKPDVDFKRYQEEMHSDYALGFVMENDTDGEERFVSLYGDSNTFVDHYEVDFNYNVLFPIEQGVIYLQGISGGHDHMRLVDYQGETIFEEDMDNLIDIPTDDPYDYEYDGGFHISSIRELNGEIYLTLVDNDLNREFSAIATLDIDTPSIDIETFVGPSNDGIIHSVVHNDLLYFVGKDDGQTEVLTYDPSTNNYDDIALIEGEPFNYASTSWRYALPMGLIGENIVTIEENDTTEIVRTFDINGNVIASQEFDNSNDKYFDNASGEALYFWDAEDGFYYVYDFELNEFERIYAFNSNEFHNAFTTADGFIYIIYEPGNKNRVNIFGPDGSYQFRNDGPIQLAYEAAVADNDQFINIPIEYLD